MSEVILSASSAWPDGEDWQSLAKRAVQSVLKQPDNAQFGDLDDRISVSINLSDDEEVRILNSKWRGKDKPTNVLSFPMLTKAEMMALSGSSLGGAASDEIMLGDIILAHETCATEAAEKSIALDHHAAHLIVHGMLHLLGHDHIEEEEAEVMETLEIKALASIGLPNPYI